MAKYLPGPFVGQLSGSQGNTVFSFNRNGTYTRNRVTPVNPGTNAQVNIRQILSSLATQWKGLTAVQRADWAALGAQIIRINSLGQSYDLSGFQAFLLINIPLVFAGSGSLSNAPAMPNLVSFLTLSLTLTQMAMTAAFTPDPVPAGYSLDVFATGPRSQGVNFVGATEFKFIQRFAAATASPADIRAAWQALFGQQAVGQKVFIKARLRDANGFVTQWLRAFAISS